MSIERGFIQSLEVRSDGWVECRLLPVHSTAGPVTLMIPNLDGDLTVAHRKLSQLAVLRDALARTLPVQVQYVVTEEEGNTIEDVTVFPSRSIEGRRASWWTTGRVVGLLIHEYGPESSSDPYVDRADTATVTLLGDVGNVESYLVDLQRPYEDTGHAILDLVSEARRNGRPVALHVLSTSGKGHDDLTDGGWVLGARWEDRPEKDIDEVLVAFVERIGQRDGSMDTSQPEAVGRALVKLTTAPEQHPEGDISVTGFVPTSREAWIATDSPLLQRAVIALREGLQVEAGLVGDEIHELELLAPLGSAGYPVWVHFGSQALPDENEGPCVNVPTIQHPDHGLLERTPHTVSWAGEAWFHQGIWRLIVASAEPTRIFIDGKELPCRLAPTEMEQSLSTPAGASPARYGLLERKMAEDMVDERRERKAVAAHAYLDGLHQIEFRISGHTCTNPFRALIHRIR